MQHNAMQYVYAYNLETAKQNIYIDKWRHSECVKWLYYDYMMAAINFKLKPASEI